MTMIGSSARPLRIPSTILNTDESTKISSPMNGISSYAEKFEAMVRLGITNTRMKDFYDLWVMASSFAFCGNSLAAALAATFGSRGTLLPVDAPVALSPEFSADPAKQAQ